MAQTTDAETEHGRAPRAGAKLVVMFELAIVAALFAADAYGYIPVSKTPELVLLAIVSMAIRRVSWKSIGFRVWRNWPATIAAGVALGAGMEALELYVTQPLLIHATGEPPDLSDFAVLRGNLKMLGIALALAWVLAAFGEEFFYRGYLLNRFRDFFAGRGVATVLAVILSSAIFGAAHAYQGTTGIIDEGLMGLILALAYVATGRNLLVPMLAHGVQDSIDVVLLYLGKYPLPGT